MTVNLWSKTAASNATIDPSINWREGQAASTVNNSARAMMAAIAKLRDDMSGNLETGGSSTAYTLATNQSLTPIADGYSITARMHAASGDSPTLNVDSTGAKQIRASLGVNIPTGALSEGGIQRFTYDLSDDSWIVHSRFGDSFNDSSAPDLAAIEDLTGTGVPKRTGDSTWALTAGVADLAATTANRLFGTDGSGASGLVTLTAPLALATGALSVNAASDSASGVLEIAAQSEMEAASSALLAVTPGRLQYHPGAAKFWAYVTVSGGTPTLAASHNVTSITDAGTGSLTVTIATDFSSANWSPNTAVRPSGGFGVAFSAIAAGSITLGAYNTSNGAATDPEAYGVSGFGAQ